MAEILTLAQNILFTNFSFEIYFTWNLAATKKSFTVVGSGGILLN
jgi:hypothetical protein